MFVDNIKILKSINKDGKITQRKLAEQTGISLGKVNTILKDLNEKKYIIINDNNKKIKLKYSITKEGLEFLENELNKIKNTKLDIHEDGFYKVKEAVILGAGERTEFEIPVGFLNLEEFNVIERIINLLKINGIKKIIIVVGYKKEYYENLSEKYNNIFLVENLNYNKTGTMHSLSLARKYISDDFLLIENDLVFESRALEQIINNNNRNCILLANESGSNDESFVEIRDGYLYKMSKDIHQFNNIHGEMVGISKISYKMYNMMLDEFSNNTNPYTNYEYTLLDVSRIYKVGYEKINDLLWGEIDNRDQYKKVKNYIGPKIILKEKNLMVKKSR